MSGIFNPVIFNNTIFNTGDAGAVVPDVVKTGTGGIDGGTTGGGLKRKGIVKPLGTLGLKRKVESRVDESREIQSEIASRLAREFAEETIAIEARPPIASMSMQEIEFEIGALLRKQFRTQQDEDVLILLMIAAAL